MSDYDLRFDARRATAWADIAALRAQRVKDRRSARPGSVALDAPHKYEIVGSDKNQVYGASLADLRTLCEQDELSGRTDFPLHAFHNGLYRPLTFLETWQARVREYRANGNRAGPLLDSWLDTCTGIAYQKKTGKFKLAPIADELLGLDSTFNQSFVPIDYDAVPGREFNPKSAIYNQLLTREQVLDHEGWNAAFEGNRSALEEASEIAFAEVERRHQRNTAMRFWLVEKPKEDQLRPLCANNPELIYGADGDWNLDGNDGRFVRVRPR